MSGWAAVVFVLDRTAGWAGFLIRRRWRRAVSAEELTHLGRYLVAALRQGLPLVESVKAYAAGIRSAWLKRVYEEAAGKLEAGSSLSQALASTPGYFPEAFIAVARAGEEQDDLPRGLETAVDLMGQDTEFIRRCGWSLLYAAIVAGVTLSVFGFMMAFVIPSFQKIIFSFATPKAAASILPWPTLLLFWLTDRSGLALSCLALGVLAAGSYRWYSGVPLAELAVLWLPPVRKIRAKSRETLFCRTLGRLLQAGCSMDKALELTGSVDADKAFRAAVDQARAGVNKGRKLSETLGEAPAFSRSLAWACSLGEERGNLPETLLWLGDYNALWIQWRHERLLPWLERSANIALGLLVGFYLVAVMTPLLGMGGLAPN
ncbi:MAG: type II secretion system F family protein [Elusimicrobia bacterium]|nr:type II secretion system F family protein [Elusimicrobiota bacterium]